MRSDVISFKDSVTECLSTGQTHKVCSTITWPRSLRGLQIIIMENILGLHNLGEKKKKNLHVIFLIKVTVI